MPLPDNKEGVLGLRVTRALEHPSDKPEVFTDAAGKPTTVAKLDNTGVTGRYLTSEGKTGDAAWGTRGRWCVLSGTRRHRAGRDRDPRPSVERRLSRPTGMRAATGCSRPTRSGRRISAPGKDVLNYALDAGQTVTFRHRIEITSGTPTAEDVEAAWKRWAQ